MKTKTATRHARPWQMLLLALFAWLTPQQVQASDWMLDDGYFKATAYSDHIRFEVLLCDLVRKNTYSKAVTSMPPVRVATPPTTSSSTWSTTTTTMTPIPTLRRTSRPRLSMKAPRRSSVPAMRFLPA